jgi:hypothetical protein
MHVIATMRLDRPWIEHPSDSIVSVSTFADNLAYAIVRVSSAGTQRAKAVYVVPWREDPVRFTEWIEVKELAIWISKWCLRKLASCSLRGITTLA